MKWLNEDTLIISDTHFFHENSRGGIRAYANRPSNHFGLMVANWNLYCQPEDNILHLGDFSLGKKDKVKALAKILNGNKYLINGNHDSRKTLHKLVGFTYFERDQMLFKKFGKYLLIFSHIPVYKIKHPLTYNLHGHIHQNDSPTDNHINMCVEVRDYRPWKLGEILKEIEEKNEKVSN